MRFTAQDFEDDISGNSLEDLERIAFYINKMNKRMPSTINLKTQGRDDLVYEDLKLLWSDTRYVLSKLSEMLDLEFLD